MDYPGPLAIRYPKSKADVFPTGCQEEKIVHGCPQVIRSKGDLAIVALGSMLLPAVSAADILERKGINVRVINARFACPLDASAWKDALNGCKIVVTVEEGISDGGFGAELADLLLGQVWVYKMGLPRRFIPHGPRSNILADYHLDAAGIASRVDELICSQDN